MQILFTRFPLESAYGGAEVQTLTLAQGLLKKGHDVSFLGSCPTLCEGMTKLQIPISKLDIGTPPVTKWGAISFSWRQFGMRKKLIGELTKLSAISYQLSAIFMLSLSEKLLLTDWAVAQGIKVFWIEHDRIGRWFTMNPWMAKLRKLSKLATTIVVSDLSRDLYLKMGWDPKKTVSIPNGVDREKYKPHEVLRQAQHDVLHIGCITRLTRDKGVDVLIEAMKDLENVSLTIVGTGRERRNIRALINPVNQQTSKPITLLPTVDPKNFYQTIDVLVLPSRDHDPFGLVAAEAMASGIPVIVTDACGIALHLTSGEDALIVPAGSVQELHNAILTLQKFPQLRQKLAERGPIVARKKFSAERMVKRYEELM